MWKLCIAAAASQVVCEGEYSWTQRGRYTEKTMAQGQVDNESGRWLGFAIFCLSVDAVV